VHCKLVGQRDSAVIEAAYRDPRDCLKRQILRFIVEQKGNNLYGQKQEIHGSSSSFII
jgi:hypothetical protein